MLHFAHMRHASVLGARVGQARLERVEIAHALAAARHVHVGAVDHHLARAGTCVVVRAHRHAVSARRAHGEKIALLDDERALSLDPVTVNRLRRVREARRSER